MTRTRLTPAERRERARLCSERWRRAHGIGPRSPHKGRGWLWASRAAPRAKARQQAALAQAVAAREAVLDRLAWQVAELRASLDQCAMHEAMAAELN